MCDIFTLHVLSIPREDAPSPPFLTVSLVLYRSLAAPLITPYDSVGSEIQHLRPGQKAMISTEPIEFVETGHSA